MSVPKKRNRPHVSNTPVVKKGLVYNKIIPVAVVIFMLFGAGFSYLMVGVDTTSLVTGILIGGVCGFFFGLLIAKSLSGK
jgi:hypothetical protein